MHSIRVIGKPKVEDRSSVRAVARVAPQQIRAMQIVMRPQRVQRRQQRPELRVKRLQQLQGLLAAMGHSIVYCKHRASCQIAVKRSTCVLLSENRKACYQRLRLAARRLEICCGEMQPCQLLPGGPCMCGCA